MENLNGITLMRAEAYHQCNPQPGGRERHRSCTTNLKREYDNRDSISPVMVAARRAGMKFPWVWAPFRHYLCLCQPAGQPCRCKSCRRRNVQLLSWALTQVMWDRVPWQWKAWVALNKKHCLPSVQSIKWHIDTLNPGFIMYERILFLRNTNMAGILRSSCERAFCSLEIGQNISSATIC